MAYLCGSQEIAPFVLDIAPAGAKAKKGAATDTMQIVALIKAAAPAGRGRTPPSLAQLPKGQRRHWSHA
jgi:hypothetical protein